MVQDVITYSAAISACENAKQSDKAFKLLDKVRQLGLELGRMGWRPRVADVAYPACSVVDVPAPLDSS